MIKKCALFILFSLFVGLQTSYADYKYKYAYIYNEYNKKLCALEIETNKIKNINYNDILLLEKPTHLEETSSIYDSAHQVYFIKISNEKRNWFIIDKNNPSHNYFVSTSPKDVSNYKSYLFDNYIFYHTYDKKKKRLDYYVLNLKNKKVTKLGLNSDLKSLPSKTQKYIIKTLKDGYYDYHFMETENFIFSEDKLYFTLKYFVGGGGVGRQPYLTYVRWVSFDTKNNKYHVEKENFYNVEAVYKISSEETLIFTREKIIKYHLKTNKAEEYAHQLNFATANDILDKTVDIYPLTYENNKIYFLTNDNYIEMPKMQILSYDFEKSIILFQKKYKLSLIETNTINNKFCSIFTDYDNENTTFQVISKKGKQIFAITVKGTYPKLILQKGTNIYITTYTKQNLLTLLIFNTSKGIIKKISL